jgi:acetyl-CoA C-acetyltransferase
MDCARRRVSSGSRLQTDRRCGGGLQALVTAAMMVRRAPATSCSRASRHVEHRILHDRHALGKRSWTTQFYDRLDRGRERSQPVHRLAHLGYRDRREPAKDYRSRGKTPTPSRRSHRAPLRRDEGRFADEVVPVPVPQRRGDLSQSRATRASVPKARPRPSPAQSDYEGGNVTPQRGAAE